MFVIGERYRRAALHELFGGQQQGGISTPARHPFIMLFTGESGEQYGYRDGWTGESVFLYTGEGQEGDMQFVRGNLAIRDHQGHDKRLFRVVERGYVEFLGEMVCDGYEERRGPDIHGTLRKVIVFRLRPI